MNFLNEAASRYSGALSLASGRPDIAAVQQAMPWLRSAYTASAGMADEPGALQYGPTAGIVNDVLATWVADRSSARVEAERVLVTTGCQEAMAIALLASCTPATDALLVPDPTYLGIVGAAMMLGIDVFPIGNPQDIDEAAIERGIADAARAGRRARAVYVIPDHDNPTGRSLDLDARLALLRAARRNGLVVLEDVAYREFGYDGQSLPSLLSMDDADVMQLGTFSKILFPALRLGYLAINRRAGSPEVIDACRAAKSFLTVNTVTSTQQILSYAIGRNADGVLSGLERLRQHYAAKRDAVVDVLQQSGMATRGVTWNIPAGGFFLTVQLPFAFGDAELARCAQDFGVICTPMRYFALSDRSDRDVRISFSALESTDLRTAVGRFAEFVAATAAPDRSSDRDGERLRDRLIA